MVLNIITGTRFSQIKLFLMTNKFFNTSKLTTFISRQDDNYVVKIYKNSVKIVLSNQCKKNDYNKIKEYIKKIFNNQSILIVSSSDLIWLNDIENVTIHTLKKAV